MRGVDWLLVFRFVDIPLSGERQSESVKNRQQLVEPNAGGVSQLERCEQALRNTGFFSEGGTGNSLRLTRLAHVDSGLARCCDGKSIHGDILTCRVLHISMTCKTLHEKASCNTLHEALPKRLVLKGVLQHQNPQVLQQNLEADEDEHDAAHDGGGLFVARAEGVADRHTGDGEDEGRDTDKRHGGDDVD